MPAAELLALAEVIRERNAPRDATLQEVYGAYPHKIFDVLNWAANEGRPYDGQDPNRLHWLSCIGVIEEPSEHTAVDFRIGVVPDGLDTEVVAGDASLWPDAVAGMAQTIVAYTLHRPSEAAPD